MSIELTKLECLYYHKREDKHVKFLETYEPYGKLRTINTVRSGNKLIINGHTIVNSAEE